ncbi:PhzF family phenazine biosynthesis protein [Rhizobium straminoryzae]|uniref:PhzF family phenazine biosynthesis protein n=1 Tax=Rhizobium straminoryzae TaxID=1387186 RepID=A0A549T6J5_9HYPH|nr:PhzF family phenazine biosynthesis protein [Rhizobium straminoryzae]TRL37460.1 PhzF family phenazine biosynthesis protein [Rhizobium straminoryzae]
MTTPLSFRQVDVFSGERLRGNALAVVHDADGLSDADMAAFARWTNLSETTFLLKPTRAGADYRVRIFTPREELPFAGHPTLGSCHSWLEAGGRPAGDHVIQECGAGLIPVRRSGETLAFQAPPMLRTGAVEEAILVRIMEGLGLPREAALAAEWVDNGPGWLAVLLASRQTVLSVMPDFQRLRGMRVGIFARCTADDATDADIEVRGFTAAGFEDPVTGSLNAGLACWLTSAGLAPARYVAAQGTAIGRAGRVAVQQDGNGLWIGGSVATVITGTMTL